MKKQLEDFKKESRKLISSLLKFSKHMKTVARETKKVEKTLKQEPEFDINLN